MSERQKVPVVMVVPPEVVTVWDASAHILRDMDFGCVADAAAQTAKRLRGGELAPTLITPDGRSWEITDSRIPKAGDFYFWNGDWWISRNDGTLERPILKPIDFMLAGTDGMSDAEIVALEKVVAYGIVDDRAATPNPDGGTEK